MDQHTNFNLEQLLPKHTRLIPRLHRDLSEYLPGLPASWQTALQDPGDPGQAAARLWHPLLTIARGFIFRLENITMELGLVVSDSGTLPSHLLYICQSGQSQHGWLGGSPASEEELVTFEGYLGNKLPESYRAILQIHDGFIDTDRPEIGFWSLKQVRRISITDLSSPQEQNLNLLSFSEDRAGQLHTYNLNSLNGKGDYRTCVWDARTLSLSQPKSFWSYMKEFAIHTLK